MIIASLEVWLKAGRPGTIRVLCVFGLMGFFLAAREAQASPSTNREDSPANPGSAFAMAIRGTAGVADFDGDSRADVAFARPRGLVNGAYQYQIEVLLSAQSRTTFEVESGPAGGGLHISARDIDGDRDLDLVITTEFGGEPVGVWINDGHGRFTQANAAIYPASIWQEIKEAVGRPYSPQRVDLSCVLPGGGYSVGPEGLRLPPLTNPEGPLQSTSDGHVSHPWNLGRPLRAPPVL